MTILTDVKDVCGVGASNSGFDNELLLLVNSGCSTLTLLGVSEFADLVVNEATDWPVIDSPEDVELTNLVKHHLLLQSKLAFDPPASQSISQQLEAQVSSLATQIEMLVTAKEVVV